MTFDLIINILQLIIIAIALFFLVRYFRSLFMENRFMPESWKYAVRNNSVSVELKKYQRSFKDKIRFYNTWLQFERIKKDNIPGCFAELGVYKGETARLIHLLDPGETFYLFDTFEGFDQKDLEKESGEAAEYTTRNFADTSIEKVKAFVKGNDNVKYIPGYFPESAKGLENEKFALVNIDTDLFNPIKAGLEFFYPKLSKGGVIIIHDYNQKWEGAMKAVDEFAAINKISIIPVPDSQNSVMICKS